MPEKVQVALLIAKVLRKISRLWFYSRNPIGFARSLGVSVGDECRLIGVNDMTFGSEPYLVTLGNHVTITSGVRFITHDGGVWVFRHEFPDIDVVAPVRVGNNVFIGINCIIMPGVTIGDNCVIGAGSIVCSDIPAGSVAVGVPARVVKPIYAYRDKVLKRALYIRSLQHKDKRLILEERFRHG